MYALRASGLGLAVVLLLAGCAVADSEALDSDTQLLVDMASLASGTELVATKQVSLHSAPASNASVLATVPEKAVVTIASSATSNGFYNVTYNGTTGWIAGAELAPAVDYPIQGEMLAAWERLGGEARFGLPMEAERSGPGGTVQHFQRGCIGPDGSGALAASSVCEEPPDLQPVLVRIWQTIKQRSNRTNQAMAVEWLPTKQRWAQFGDEKHVSASSPKWSWAMAALARKTIPQVEPAAIPTFETSDNGTAGQLIDLAGGIDAVNDFTINKLGIPQESFNLCYWGNRRASRCSQAMGSNNFFTPNGTLLFLEKAWERAGIGQVKGDKVLEWALRAPRTGYGGWLGTQLPSGARPSMYHKAGWLPPGCCSSDAQLNNMNEIGIIVTPRGPYAVSILLDKGTDYWGAQKTSMEWASCVIYHAFAKDVADPFAAGCVSP